MIAGFGNRSRVAGGLTEDEDNFINLHRPTFINTSSFHQELGTARWLVPGRCHDLLHTVVFHMKYFLLLHQ